MNCKPGDLALIVRCEIDDDVIGLVVRCESYEGRARINDVQYLDAWIVDYQGKRPPRDGFGCSDSWLRPIRDSDGEDEMLRIAGKPMQQPATQTAESTQEKP
jgi:hypothetical protein